MLYFILKFAFTFLLLLILVKIQSFIEKISISKKIEPKIFIIEKKSKNIFKICLILILLLITIENNYYQTETFKSLKNIFLFVGILLYIFGFTLRILAIRELGRYWSFNIELKLNHKMINSGIYKYIKHPGYLGNLYIVGISFFMGAIFTSIVSLIFITIFAFYRIRLEKKYILNPLRKNKFTNIQ